MSTAVVEADDNIPGVEVDFSSNGTISLNGTLSDSSDYDDVYAVFLTAGEMINVSLSADGASTDYGLYVYGTGATDVFSDSPDDGVNPYYYGGPDSYPATLDFLAPVTGYYFIDVWTWYDSDASQSGGSGPYSLYVDCVRQDTDVTITTKPGTTAFDTYRTIYGSVSGRFRPVSGPLYLYYSFDGMDYMPLAGQDYSGGTFSFPTFRQWRKTWYMVVFEGSGVDATNAQTIFFNCSASMGNPIAPSTMRKGRSATVYGYLKPRHTSGTYPVRIYKWRYVSGKWKSYGYFSAKAYNYSDYTKYSRSVSLPYTGKWKLRAYHPADSQHAATWSSGYDYVTVK